jgi:hypothetical protein
VVNGISSFGQIGPQGLVGPQGPGGPVGPTGPTGPNSLSGLLDVSIPSNTLINGYALMYNGPLNKWTPQAIPMSRAVYLSISITSVMQPGEVLMQYALPEAVTIPAGGAAGTYAIASLPAQGMVTCIVNKVINNITQPVGSVIWQPGAVVGTVILPNKIYLIAGDVLQLVAPAVSDPTLANIGVTFACVKGG